MKKLFKNKKFLKEIFKLLIIITLCLIFNNLINSTFLREGFKRKGSAKIPSNKTYDPDGRAQDIKNRTNKQTEQSKVNHQLINATKPK